MSLYEKSFYQLENNELEALVKAVYELMTAVKDETNADLTGEDSWTDFIYLATDSTRYASLASEILTPAMPENPFAMLGLVNYINAYLIDDFGECQAVKVWDSRGKNGIFQHTALAIARNFFLSKEEFDAFDPDNFEI